MSQYQAETYQRIAPMKMWIRYDIKSRDQIRSDIILPGRNYKNEQIDRREGTMACIVPKEVKLMITHKDHYMA